MDRAEFRDLIKRGFGWPLVNVELLDMHIDDNIYKAAQKYSRFAVGNATQECFGTMMLSGGQRFYDMPAGTTEVIKVDDYGKEGGINTLFTIDNFLYSQGAMNFFAQSSGYSLVDYHTTLGFLKTLRRYSPSRYTYKYHKGSNKLEVTPAPATDRFITISQPVSAGSSVYQDVVVNSGGFVLLKSMMLEGATEPGWVMEDFYERMFEKDWFIDYVTALCKITLGMIRRKMENASNTVGNTSLTMDGSALMSEGKEEKTALEEKLQTEESYESYGISLGQC